MNNNKEEEERDLTQFQNFFIISLSSYIFRHTHTQKNQSQSDSFFLSILLYLQTLFIYLFNTKKN